MITKSLEGLSIESATDFQKVLRVKTYTSEASAVKRLTEELPVFQSRMGAMLFLISALLSRGLVWFCSLPTHLICLLCFFGYHSLPSLTFSDLSTEILH